MRYLPLFYVICSHDGKNNITFKLITHHGKVVDTMTKKDTLEDNSPTEEEEWIRFVEQLTKLKMCHGVENLKFLNVPHLAEQLEQNLIIRSRECKFALFEDEVICEACKSLCKHKNTKLHSKATSKRRRPQSRTSISAGHVDPCETSSSCNNQIADALSPAVKEEFVHGAIQEIDKVHYNIDSESIQIPEDVLMDDIEWDDNQPHDETSLSGVECNLFPPISKKNGANDDESSESWATKQSLQTTRVVGYNCDKCVYKCSTKSQLNKHISQIHNSNVISNESNNENNDDLMYNCEECSFQSSEKASLQEHVNEAHMNVKSFVCKKCDQEFSSKAVLNKHRRHEHQQEQVSTIKAFKCPSCDFITSRKTGLTDHINAVHDKVKPYMCQHCSHTFASNGNLTQHIHAVHEKLRPFICHLCTYATSSQPNLRKHIKAVHHKIRDFKCDICPFDAASKQLLVRHVKAVHEKIKAHKCKYCQYECAKGYNMKVHIRHVHEKQKGYKCEQCAFEATRKGKLSDHILACHASDVVAATQVDINNVVSPTETIIVQSATTIETHSILVD